MLKNAFNILQTKRHQLDAHNRKIVAELLQNARQSFTEIAKKTHLSKHSVQYRYHQLLKRGIVLQTYADVDFHKIGFEKFHLLLVLDEMQQNRHPLFLEHLGKHPAVFQVIEFNDTWDLEVVVLARNLQQFDDIVHELLDPFAEVVYKKDTEAVIREQERLPEIGIVRTRKREHLVAVDKYDLSILSAVGKDARISTYTLASQVGLSPDAIRLRIKKLQQQNVIEGFTCRLNFSALKYLGFTFSFTSGCFPKKEEEKLFTFVGQNIYTLSLKKLIGNWDYKYYLTVRDLAEFHDAVKELKRAFPKYVQNYETLVIYKEHFFHPCPEIVRGI